MLGTKRRIIDQKRLSDHEQKNLMIFEIIRRKGPLARADIARQVDLNNVTVTSYVDQYLKKKVLKEVGMQSSTGGRKPTLVDLDPEVAYAIGVGLNTADLVAVLCDLKGNVVHKVKITGTLKIRERLIDHMIEIIGRLLKESGVDVAKVHGVGVGVPGIVNQNNGTVRWPFGLLSGDLSVNTSISNLIYDKYELPVILDNDANTAVFAEQWGSPEGLNVDSAVYMYSGSGCGLMFNGQIHRGFSGSAGEHLFDLAKEDPLAWLRDSIESGHWWIDLGMTHRAEKELSKNKSSKLHELCGGDPEKITLDLLSQAAEAGDDFVQNILKEAGQTLGHKAALIANLINPEVIIIGGGVEAAGVQFLDAVREEVKNASVPEASSSLRITPSQLGEDAVPIGAAAIVIQNYYISI